MTKHFATVFDRDNRRCVYCGRDLLVDFETFMLAEEDHLIPVSKGGAAHDVQNIVIAGSWRNEGLWSGADQESRAI